MTGTMSRRLWVLGSVLALVALACGGGDGDARTSQPAPTAASAGDAAAGEALFAGTCFACHGPDAKGIPGLGKTLVGSDFANGLSDAALVEFIKTGRPIDDPLNTTEVEMPPRGGNSELSDEDLGDIVAFIRSLN